MDENKEYLGAQGEGGEEPVTDEAVNETEQAQQSAPDEAPAESDAVESAGAYREPLTDSYCIRCGENKKEEGSDYCEECAKALLSVKIPALAWIGTLITLCVSILASAVFFLNFSAGFQVAVGDYWAARGAWSTASEYYNKVDATAEEINNAVGSFSPVVIGERVRVKSVIATAHLYSPIDAGYKISSDYKQLAGKYRKLAPYERAYEQYKAVYTACSDILDACTSGNKTYEEAIKDIDAAIEADKTLNTTYANSLKFDISRYTVQKPEISLTFLKDMEKSAPDEGWLYNKNYVDLYLMMKDYDSALIYCDRLIDFNCNDGEAYFKKLLVLMSKNDKEGAGKLCDEFDRLNPDSETVYSLRTAYMRRFGDLDSAKTYCQEGIDEFQSVAEHYRQMAIINLLQGDYDTAFDSVYDGEYMAYSLYYYSGSQSMYTQELSDMLYLCAKLCFEHGKGTGKSADSVKSVMESFEGEDESISQDVKDIIAGTKTLEQVFREGDGDVL